MLLGIFTTILNAITGAAVKIVVPILELAANAITPILTALLEAAAKGVASFVPLIVQLGIKILNCIFSQVKFGKNGGQTVNEMMVDSIIKSVGKMYDTMKGGYVVEMLGWTPINFFVGGKDSEVKEGVMNNPYFASLHLMKEGIMPVAMTIFSLVVLVELFQLTVRTEGMRNSGFESPFKLMLKVAICKILLDNTQMVLESIFSLGYETYSKLVTAAKGISLADGAQWDSIRVVLLGDGKTYPGVDWFTLLMLWLQMLVQLGCIKVVMMIVPFFVFGRMAELYICITLAPIPFATFASQEFSQVGKNFLKQFIGISLRGAVMFVIIVLFCLLATIMTFDMTNVDAISHLVTLVANTIYWSGPWAGVGVFLAMIGFKPIIFSVFLLMTIANSEKYTKLITGAWY